MSKPVTECIGMINGWPTWVAWHEGEDRMRWGGWGRSETEALEDLKRMDWERADSEEAAITHEGEYETEEQRLGPGGWNWRP